MPEASFSSAFECILSMTPATLTMKNSSKLDSVMERNFTLSIMGFSFSKASSSTRLLKSSQLSSLLRYGQSGSEKAFIREMDSFLDFWEVFLSSFFLSPKIINLSMLILELYQIFFELSRFYVEFVQFVHKKGTRHISPYPIRFS